MVGVIWGQTRYLGAGGANRGQTQHLARGAGLLTRWTCPSACRGVEAAPGHPDLGTGMMFGMPIQNVQRATFNSQLSMG